MDRYTGLGIPSSFGGIFLGIEDTHVQENIPYGEVFQLGWGSVLYFEKQEDGFTNLLVQNLRSEKATSPAGAFRQVVTRGVNSCSAIAIMHGTFGCLMHLDARDLRSRRKEILDSVIVHLRRYTGMSDAYIVASTIHDPEEIEFVHALEAVCRETQYPTHLRHINRGVVGTHYAHVEFGIADTDEIYGDRYEKSQGIVRKFCFPISIQE